MHWLSPRQCRERSALVAAGFPRTTSLYIPAQAEQIIQFCSLHATVQHWIWGSNNWGRHSTLGYRGNLVPGWDLGGGVETTIVGAYLNSTPEAAQISDGSFPTTVQFLTHNNSLCGPWPTLWSSSTTRRGTQRLGIMIE